MTGPSDPEATRPLGTRVDPTQPIGPPRGGPPGGGPYDDEEEGRPWWLYALGVVLLGVVVGVAIALATSGDDDEPTLDTTTSSTSTSSTTTAPPPTSPPTSPTTAAPTPPGQVTGLTAGPGGGSGEVSVSWNAVPGAVSYNIYRSSSSGTSGPLIATVNGTSYVDTPGEPAYYQVSAVNSSGLEGQRSAEDCGAPVGDSC